MKELLAELSDVTKPLIYVVSGLFGFIVLFAGLAVRQSASSRRTYKIGGKVSLAGVIIVCITLIEAGIIWLATYEPPRSLHP